MDIERLINLEFNRYRMQQKLSIKNVKKPYLPELGLRPQQMTMVTAQKTDETTLFSS
jgi:hypothetical protein